MIQSLSVHYQYRNEPIRIDTVIMLFWYIWKNSFTQVWLSYNLAKDLSTLSLILIMLNKYLTWCIKLWYKLHWWSFHFSTSICWIHCIDQPKTFTLLLKSKILDYVSYRQGLYQIHNVSAADRIVPALLFTFVNNSVLYMYVQQRYGLL